MQKYFMVKQVLEKLRNKCNVSFDCTEHYITVLTKKMKKNEVTRETKSYLEIGKIIFEKF